MRSRLLLLPAAAVTFALGSADVSSAAWSADGAGTTDARSSSLAAPAGLTAVQACATTTSERPATIAHRSASSATGSGTAVTVSTPTGVQSGDLLVAAHVDTSDGAPATPAGWTYRGNINHTTANVLSVAVFTRVVPSGEVGSHTWTAGAGGPTVVSVTAYSGVDTANPLGAGSGAAGTGTSVTAPTVTPTKAASRLVAVFGIRAASTLTAPTSMTARTTNAATGATGVLPVTALVSDEGYGAASATGTRVASGTASGNSVGVLLALAPAMLDGTIIYRAAATATGTTAVSLTVPAGTSAGDLLLVGFGKRLAAGATIGTPSGWVRSRPADVVGGDYQQTVFWRLASATDAGTAYSFTSTTTGSSVAVMLVYRGVDRVSPIVTDSGLAVAATTAVTAPALEPGRADTRLVGLFGAQAVGTAPAVPAGMALRGSAAHNSGNNAGRLALSAADEPWPSDGSTGTRTATASASANVVGQLVALKPESFPVLTMNWVATTSSYASGYDLEIYQGEDLFHATAPGTAQSEAVGRVEAGASYRAQLRSRVAAWRSPYTEVVFTASSHC